MGNSAKLRKEVVIWGIARFQFQISLIVLVSKPDKFIGQKFHVVE